MIVPIDLLKPILEDMKSYGRPNRPARPWLGFLVQDIGDHLVVANVYDGCPADRAGLKVGDLVVEVAGGVRRRARGTVSQGVEYRPGRESYPPHDRPGRRSARGGAGINRSGRPVEARRRPLTALLRRVPRRNDRATIQRASDALGFPNHECAGCPHGPHGRARKVSIPRHRRVHLPGPGIDPAFEVVNVREPLRAEVLGRRHAPHAGVGSRRRAAYPSGEPTLSASPGRRAGWNPRCVLVIAPRGFVRRQASGPESAS